MMSVTMLRGLRRCLFRKIKSGMLSARAARSFARFVEVTGAKIDIDDDGTIKVAAITAEAGEAALEWIQGIVAEPEVGVIYEGKVVKVVDFGAFVNFLGAKDGLVHISELAPQRVGKVTDIVNEGDQVKVKVLAVDDRGKVKLSMKVVDQETGEEISGKPKEEAPSEEA